MATVVVGFVPKPEGEAALLAAMAQVQRDGGRLVVANTHRQGESDPEWIARTEAELAAARERLEAAGLDYVIQLGETDAEVDAADELVQTARDEHADLIVIGIRRRTATGKLILGSQAQRILLDAPCPVLAVKPE